MNSDIPWSVHLLTGIFLEMILCFSFPDINKTQAKGKRVVFRRIRLPYF